MFLTYRFLRKDDKTNRWYDVGDVKARLTIYNMIRSEVEILHEKRPTIPPIRFSPNESKTGARSRGVGENGEYNNDIERAVKEASKVRPYPRARTIALIPGIAVYNSVVDLTPAVVAPEENDIICGGGRIAQEANVSHPGNIKLRQMILARLEDYKLANRPEDKKRIVAEILDELQSGEKPSRYEFIYMKPEDITLPKT